MILKLETERLSTLDEVRMFVAGSAAVDFAGLDRESTYEFTRRTLARFGYGRLGKADKGLLRRYLTKATGLSRAQVALLEKLRIEFTRSRPRRSNDNALVESKNGSVVRRHLGHAHIPAASRRSSTSSPAARCRPA